MGKFIDLTGQVFGRLTVLGRGPNKNKEIYWRCFCDICNKEQNISSTKLKKQHTNPSSCGCVGAGPNLIGKVYGELVVTERVFTGTKHSHWKVQCSCGVQKIIRGCSLTSGSTTSCGCYAKKIAKEIHTKNLVGRKFGRLVVIEDSGKRSKSGALLWKCHCSCGNTSYVRTTDLLSKGTSSCGCARLEHITKHGLSRTKLYSKSMSKIRNDKKNKLDRGWTVLMEQCLHLYQSVCVVCGDTEKLTVDHVIPLSKGGGLYPGNVCILCKRHNSMKGAKSLDQLPIEMANKIRDAAESFRVAWSGGF